MHAFHKRNILSRYRENKKMCVCTGSQSAPIARCEHSSKEIYDADIVGAQNLCVFVSAPEGSHSAPFAKCKHFLREIYDLDTPNLQNTSVFVLAPNGSHSAPIAKCAHRWRKTYNFKIALATAPAGSHHGSHLNLKKPQAKHLLLLTAPTLLYITK